MTDTAVKPEPAAAAAEPPPPRPRRRGRSRWSAVGSTVQLGTQRASDLEDAVSALHTQSDLDFLRLVAGE